MTQRLKGKQPEPGADAATEAEEFPNGHRTLFFGVPLRSKRGRETFLAIQGVVNRLEASGFPVQRYHADRAKELRTGALIGWLKDKGIHATWTAGESPAGNRAELGVQCLKAFIRKLLFVAHLDKFYWPLALQHASARNWSNFCESLGVPQPPLLPFGLKVHARRRTRTGYQAQWESRTVEGVYMGLAPNTPGGHLVLLEETDGHRVLLTNTVYPLREHSVAETKPRYRLRAKRSPPFALRVVAATDLTVACAVDARCVPGGESLSFQECGGCFGDFEVLKVGECDEGVDGRPLSTSSDSERNLYPSCGWEETCEGSGVFREPGEGFDSESENELGCSGPESEDEPARVTRLNGKVGFGALQESRVDGFRDEGWGLGFSDAECREVLDSRLTGIPVARRPMLRGQGRAVLFGLYGIGGFRGISKATFVQPEVVQYINGYVRSKCPGHVWTTLYVSRNAHAPLHRDLRNAKGFKIWVKALGDFTGGGFWVEDPEAQGTVLKALPDGSKRSGSVWDLRLEGKLFSGESWHASEEWEGKVRWVISAFTPRELTSVSEEQWLQLSEVGFPVEAVRSKLGPGGAQVSKVTESIEGPVLPGNDLDEWTLAIPIPIENGDLRRSLDHLRAATVCLCRLLAVELCEVVESGLEGFDLAHQLHRSERLCDWLEQCLGTDEGLENVGVRALQAEVPIGESEVSSDQFLQTRSVGFVEARRELAKWREPANDEIVSLETTNRAVDRVKASVIDEWANQGINVVQLPGKVVLTRKSGVGKRRCRAVCCGNYLPAEKLGLTKEDLYASGAEALSVKLALIFAARSPWWIGVTIDVKSAFLYAPIRSSQGGSEERIVVKPPSFLVELGLLERDDRWWIKKALYGLPTSPKDWGNYRDREFVTLKFVSKGITYCLTQMKSDDALWLAREVREGCFGDVAGVLIVYVDDLAFLGPEDLCWQFVTAIRAKWKTSDPEWIGERPTTFCGIELSRSEAGFRMTQRAYTQELLNRYNVDEEAGVPIAKWTEPESTEPVRADRVKEAQALTGALLWLSTRTRPDLAYVVSRCGQQATKCPDLSIALGRQALAYLKSTIDMGIDVPFEVGSVFSDHGLLSLPRTDRVLELYTDASHSPNGERSTQSVFLLWRGVPAAWESTRQPFVTLSSAESELVCMMHGVKLAEAVQPLIDELIEGDSIVSLLGDNEAAIRAFESTPSGWRNRHLRMRALAGRERVSANLLKVTHLPGNYQVADLGTKPLARSRILQLLELMNIRSRVTADPGAQVARLVSRLSLVHGAEFRIAEAVAGLALLASIPGAKGQPVEESGRSCVWGPRWGASSCSDHCSFGLGLVV